MAPNPITIQYQLTQEDYVEAQLAYLKGSLMWWKKNLDVMFAAALLLAALTQFTIRVYVPGALFLIVALYLGTARRWLLPRRFRREFRKLPRLQARATVEFSEDGIHTRSEFASSEQNWKAFSRFLESQNLFLLFSQPRLFQIFPKRAFPDGKLADFQDLIARKLPARL